MRIVFLGPPASGKGTQSSIVCKKLGIPTISTGDMLRTAKAEGWLEQSLIAKMAEGGLLPDEVVLQLIERRIKNKDCQEGFLLDGFPRTLHQAEALDKLLAGFGQKIDVALAFQVPRSLVEERAILRRVDKQTGQVYHLKYNPPPLNAKLEHRVDDQEEVVRYRLDVYEKTSKEVLAFYEKDDRLYCINGVGTIEEITERILNILQNCLKINFN